jgi:hypothetical protein
MGNQQIGKVHVFVNLSTVTEERSYAGRNHPKIHENRDIGILSLGKHTMGAMKCLGATENVRSDQDRTAQGKTY